MAWYATSCNPLTFYLLFRLQNRGGLRTERRGVGAHNLPPTLTQQPSLSTSELVLATRNLPPGYPLTVRAPLHGFPGAFIDSGADPVGCGVFAAAPEILPYRPGRWPLSLVARERELGTIPSSLAVAIREALAAQLQQRLDGHLPKSGPGLQFGE